MSKELRKTIIEVFRKFSVDPHHSPLKKQKDREIASRFIDRLHTTTFDISDLPYHSKDGLARHFNKAECVFAMMCDIVLVYWTITVLDTPNAIEAAKDELTNKLILLNRVYEEYDQLKVLGDVKGYCLLSSFRKDLYGPEKEISPEKTDEGAVQMLDEDDGYGTVGGGPAPLD